MNCTLALTVVNFLHRPLTWLLVLQTQPAWHVDYGIGTKKDPWTAHQTITLMYSDRSDVQGSIGRLLCRSDSSACHINFISVKWFDKFWSCLKLVRLRFVLELIHPFFWYTVHSCSLLPDHASHLYSSSIFSLFLSILKSSCLCPVSNGLL